MKIVVPKDVVSALQPDQEGSAALACDGAAMPREIESKLENESHLLQVFPSLLNIIKSSKLVSAKTADIDKEANNNKQELYFDSERDEYIAFLARDEVCRFIPKNIYQRVHFDNKRFLDEKLVFSDAFFEATAQLVNLMFSGSQLVT